jgi:hypothetical protein
MKIQDLIEAHGNSKIYDKCWTGYKKVPGKKRGEKGSCEKIGEGLNEMDKSAPQPGRDGKVSHSTYGSRDKKGSDYFKGKEAPGKPITKKEMEKYALDILKKQGVAEGLNEFAPGSGGGESGRWYTDDQMTDIVGDGWWEDMDVSGNISKQQMIQQAQAWLDDQGYSVQVLNAKLNDDDMDWFIQGSFHNPGFAKKGVAEGGNPVDHEWYRKQQERQTKAKQRQHSVAEGSEQQWTVTVGTKTGGTSHTMTFAGTKEQAIKKAVARFGTSKNPVVKAVPAKQGVAEGGFKNKTAVFSGYSNYMRSRAPNVFKQLDIKVLNKEYFEDEDIIEYTVISDGDSLAKARATLETNPQFGGMVLKKGTTESIDADQKKAKQVPATEMPKKTSPVLGKAPKQHPFKGRAVGGGL